MEGALLKRWWLWWFNDRKTICRYSAAKSCRGKDGNPLTKEMLNKKALECISVDAVISMFELQLVVRLVATEEEVIMERNIHLYYEGAQTKTPRV